MLDFLIGHHNLCALVGAHGAFSLSGRFRAGGSAPRGRQQIGRPSRRRADGPSGRSAPTPRWRRSHRRAVAHRRRDTRHTRLTLGGALRPSAPAHLGQGAVGELRRRQHGLLGGRVAESQQHLGSRARRHRQPGADRHGIAKARRRFHRRHAHSPGALACGRAARSRPVISRSRGSTTAPAASSGSCTWPASSFSAGPSRQRP